MSEPRISRQAPHKKLYQEINENIGSYEKVTAVLGKKEDLVELTGWLDGGEVRKITAKSMSDITEFYLSKEALLFVFGVTRKPGSKKVEDRFYFDGRKLASG